MKKFEKGQRVVVECAADTAGCFWPRFAREMSDKAEFDWRTLEVVDRGASGEYVTCKIWNYSVLFNEYIVGGRTLCGCTPPEHMYAIQQNDDGDDVCNIAGQLYLFKDNNWMPVDDDDALPLTAEDVTELVADATRNAESECVCGAKHTSCPNIHLTWCPLYKEESK
jgi:hypothetical protein